MLLINLADNLFISIVWPCDLKLNPTESLRDTWPHKILANTKPIYLRSYWRLCLHVNYPIIFKWVLRLYAHFQALEQALLSHLAPIPDALFMVRGSGAIKSNNTHTNMVISSGIISRIWAIDGRCWVHEW